MGSISKKTIILSTVILAMVVYIILTVAAPLLAGDGVGGYSGDKQAAAKQAMSYSSRTNASLAHYHIDNVYPVSPEEIKLYCSQQGPTSLVTTDPTNASYYAVVVSTRTLLTFTSVSTTLYGCDPFFWEK